MSHGPASSLRLFVLGESSKLTSFKSGTRTRRKDTAAAGSYTFVITVTSFFLWYRPIYLGYKKEGGLALFFCESHSN